ncbi:hypothetical protein [Novosphingobium sp. ST904]|uniref:hypothetical protein n=1 Tax=Novosphingobium sp. ST904 TaxID=1684385 RepID=UPI001051E2C3|nr:hypothetical protein [Novosphingobium sp. ST904]TCM33774.1 hypothetical protein EDF59_11990 [Novosphingobium sp. ST904]
MGDLMSQRSNHVRLVRSNDKSDVSKAISAGWARILRTVGKGTFADSIDIGTKTIDRALTGESVPELHTALNSLAVDITALDEVFALYGLRVKPLKAEPANDLATISRLSNLAGQFAEALSDGHRDHRETCQLADTIRPLMTALTAICLEADQIKGAA